MADTTAIHGIYQQWEREESARRSQSERLKDLFKAAKADGWNPKALRVAFAERFAMGHFPSEKLVKRETDAVDIDLYLAALCVPSRMQACEDDDQVDPITGEILETDEQFSVGVQIMRDRAADHAPVGQLEIISNEGAAATETAPDYLREPPAVVSGQIIREGDAPLEADTRALVVGEVREGEHLDTELPETATETLDDLAVQDGVKMSSDGGDDLTAGLTPTWPLNPADDGQVASNSHADLTAKSGEGVASSPAPLARLKTTDEVADDMGLPGEAHPGCRKPKTCGRFSHTGLCADCRGEDREAA